jgi:hypothetical protein
MEPASSPSTLVQEIDLEDTSEQFTIVRHDKYEDTIKNVVWLNHEDYDRMFSRYVNCPFYLEVGKKVYPVGIRKCVKPGQIGLSSAQIKALKKSEGIDWVSSSITASPFIFSPSQVSHVEKVLLRIKFTLLKREIDSDITPKVIDADYFKKILLPQLIGKYVVMRQTFNIACIVANFKIKVAGLKTVTHTSNPYSLITDTTHLMFGVNLKRKHELAFVSPTVSLEADSSAIVFTIHFDNYNSSKDYYNPKQLDRNEIENRIRAFLKDKMIYEGYQFRFLVDDIVVRLVVHNVRTKSNIDHIEQPPQCTYRVGFAFNENVKIEIARTSNNFYLFKQTEPVFAKFIRLKVVRFMPKSNIKNNNLPTNWVETQEILNFFKKSNHLFQSYQSLSFETRNGKIELQVEFIAAVKEDTDVKEVERWSWDENTSFYINCEMGIDVAVIDSLDIKPIKLVTYVIDLVEDRQIFGEEELIEAVRKYSSTHIVRNQKLVVPLDDGTIINLCPNVMEFGTEFIQGYIGQITEATSFNFIPNSKDITIIPKAASSENLDPIEKLKKCGVAGLPNELNEFVRNLSFSMRNPIVTKERGLKLIRGVLLYGKHGTGKTLFACNLAPILGIHPSRVHMMSASTMLSKWIGETQKAIDKVFQPAIEEFNKKGDKAQTHLIIFDEVDSIGGDRNAEGNKHKKDVTNHLMLRMNGIDSIPNVLIVAMCNDEQWLDPALLRPGRFDKKIEFKNPDAEGRKFIFEVHI